MHAHESATEGVGIVLEIDGAELGHEEVLRGVNQYFERHSRRPRIALSTAHPQQVRSKAERVLPDGTDLEIIHALDELPGEIESPMRAFKEHKRNSVTEAMKRGKEDSSTTVICPGDTGLVLAAALFTLGRIEGIDRPPIGVPFPSREDPFLLVDGGTNVDVRPEHLVQFAVVASTFANLMWDKENPRVGLLSNGTEDYKGNELVRESRPLLENDPRINFTGAVEGNTIFNGGVEVVVCDGFVGNVLLKSSEGIARAVKSIIEETLRQRPVRGLLAKWILGPVFDEVSAKLDYSQYGGAPLLGVEGNVIICHGRSDATAFENAIRVGVELTESGILKRLHEVVEGDSETMEVSSK